MNTKISPRFFLFNLFLILSLHLSAMDFFRSGSRKSPSSSSDARFPPQDLTEFNSQQPTGIPMRQPDSYISDATDATFFTRQNLDRDPVTVFRGPSPNVPPERGIETLEDKNELHEEALNTFIPHASLLPLAEGITGLGAVGGVLPSIYR